MPGFRDRDADHLLNAIATLASRPIGVFVSMSILAESVWAHLSFLHPLRFPRKFT